MSRKDAKAAYWQEAPQPRQQLVLISQTLEALIPEDHPVRLVDEILSQLDWAPYEAAYHGRRGQPPIHPSVLAKVLLFAMLRRVRSSRQIEYELKHSIDFMWLASGRTIDHTTLSEFRRRHADARRRLRERLKTPEAQAARARRQHIGESPFAMIKVVFGMRRFLLRGIEGVGQEWRWAVTAFNLRKLMTRMAALRADRIPIVE